MSNTEKPPGNVIPFPGKAVPKFGFKRVERRKTAHMEALGQLNLFNNPPEKNAAGFGRDRPSGRVIRLSADVGPFEQALLLDERGDQNAAKMYWRAIALGDSVADSYCNLGIMENRRGNTNRAFNCFLNSIENSPRHFESHYNIANLYFDTGDLRLARRHYQTAAEIKPDYPNVYFNLGLVHAMSDDSKAAVAALSNYKELAPDLDENRADLVLSSFNRSLINP